MYNEKVKQKSRRSLLNDAINILTRQRKRSTIASPDKFNQIYDFMLNKSDYEGDKVLAKCIDKETVVSWEKHYFSTLLKAKPSDLKVAYLSGPNPENDLKLLISIGVLPENIWAFELEKEIYNEAIENLMKHYPQVKIFNGKIGDFFKITPIKFDIIYLDFCGSFFSTNKKNRNIETLVNLFENNTIKSPGALITNYAFISEDNDLNLNSTILKVIALYLYPRFTIETGESLIHWYRKIKKKQKFYYSEFISYFMMDLTSRIIPYLKMAKREELYKYFFTEPSCEELNWHLNNLFHIDNDSELLGDENNNVDLDCGGYFIDSLDNFSIPWFFNFIEEKNIKELFYGDYDDEKEEYEFYEDFYNEFYDKNFKVAINNIINQVTGGNEKLIKKISFIYYLSWGENNADKYYQERLKKVLEVDWYRIAPQACDIFSFHSIMDCAVGQLLMPYHINVNKSKRWKYKAKSTEMFTDLFVLDNCRYIYDMLPTIDMLTNRIKNISSQMCYRFVLDSINKNHLIYNPDLFFGNAVVGINNSGFEECVFKDRKKLK